jgi:O-antigen ligase
MSPNALTYLIAALVGVISLALWSWLILVPSFTAYTRWWQRTAAVVMSLYVLAAMLAAGGLVGAVFLYNFDRIG